MSALRHLRGLCAFAVLAAAGALVAPGCTSNPPPSLAVQIVAPDGGDPSVGTDVDTLTVQLRQGDGGVQQLSSPLAHLDLSLPLTDLSSPMAMTVELTGPTDHLIGAPPVFRPDQGGGLVRIPVGPPGTCAALSAGGNSSLKVSLEVARAAAAVVDEGTYALVAGGDEPSGSSSVPSASVEAYDLLRMQQAASVRDLDSPAAPVRAANLQQGRVLLVSDSTQPVIYDLFVAGQQITPVTLHSGADASSAVVSLSGGGAVVLGGGGAAPVNGVTWVHADGTTQSAHLAVPRAHAAAVELGDGSVLVAGGMADHQGLAEVIAPGDATGHVVVQGPATGAVRDDPVLIVSGGHAWLMGGTDATGAVRTDTVLIDGCPGACISSAGPSWPNARVGVAVVPTDSGALLVGGGGSSPTALVEQARLDMVPPTIEHPYDLAVSRSDAGAFELDAGVLVVVGGRGVAGPLDSVELCWPQTLTGP